MAEKRCELRLLNSNEEVLCSISVVTYYDENNEFDEGESFYIHPLTGSECQTSDQIMQGWSEKDEEYQNQWESLIARIDTDSDLYQRIWDLEKVDYYE